MNSVPKRLYDIYNEIFNCPLYLTKNNSKENLYQFQIILNKSIPTQNEYKLYKFIKDLSIHNHTFFIQLIQEYDIKHIILWSEPDSLLKYFQLDTIAYITQNYTYKQKYNKEIKVLYSYSILKFYNNPKILKRNVEEEDEDLKDNEDIQTSIITLNSLEDEYLIEETNLWNRRKKLRDELNNI